MFKTSLLIKRTELNQEPFHKRDFRLFQNIVIEELGFMGYFVVYKNENLLTLRKPILNIGPGGSENLSGDLFVPIRSLKIKLLENKNNLLVKISFYPFVFFIAILLTNIIFISTIGLAAGSSFIILSGLILIITLIVFFVTFYFARYDIMRVIKKAKEKVNKNYMHS